VETRTIWDDSRKACQRDVEDVCVRDREELRDKVNELRVGLRECDVKMAK
jgi:hypothetical protein